MPGRSVLFDRTPPRYETTMELFSRAEGASGEGEGDAEREGGEKRGGGEVILDV